MTENFPQIMNGTNALEIIELVNVKIARVFASNKIICT